MAHIHRYLIIAAGLFLLVGLVAAPTLAQEAPAQQDDKPGHGPGHGHGHGHGQGPGHGHAHGQQGNPPGQPGNPPGQPGNPSASAGDPPAQPGEAPPVKPIGRNRLADAQGRADAPPKPKCDIQREYRKHTKRLARIEKIASLATATENAELEKKAERIRMKEVRRYRRVTAKCGFKPRKLKRHTKKNR